MLELHSVRPTLQRLRNLLEPPIYCLDDVVGWSNEFEGLHQLRRGNVDFFYACSGKTPPVWTPDGIKYGINELAETKEIDAAVYSLPVEGDPATTIRGTFQLAVLTEAALENGATATDGDRSASLLRAVEAFVVALRLLELRKAQHATEASHSHDRGLSDLGRTEDLYLERASQEMMSGLERAPGELAEDFARRLQDILVPLLEAAPPASLLCAAGTCIRGYLDGRRRLSPAIQPEFASEAK